MRIVIEPDEILQLFTLVSRFRDQADKMDPLAEMLRTFHMIRGVKGADDRNLAAIVVYPAVLGVVGNDARAVGDLPAILSVDRTQCT